MILQLYLHFPFCKRKCFYCDFCSAPAGEKEIAAYCEGMKKEIRMAAGRFSNARVSTVFLGGGTPSVVPTGEMDRVLDELFTAFAVEPDAECTVEANPGTLTEEWLLMARKHGINRLSLGVQAAQERLLQKLGRVHTFAQAREAAALARRCGIQNLSMDIMFGLPNQTLGDYRETVEAVSAIGPEHLSAYGLIVEEGTPLARAVAAGTQALPSEDATADMYGKGIEWLATHGYEQYEISNFAREGYRCRHNVGYWQGAWYLGLGVAAHSMLPPEGAEAEKRIARVRQSNVTDREAYLAALAADCLPVDQRELISATDAMFESVMLGLRMTEGVSGAAFERMHGCSLKNAFGQPLDGLIADGLARWREDGGVALTARGLELQNAVLVRLMK